MKELKVTHKESLVVKPTNLQSITPETTQKTGLSQQDVEKGLPLSQALDKVRIIDFDRSLVPSLLEREFPVELQNHIAG